MPLRTPLVSLIKKQETKCEESLLLFPVPNHAQVQSIPGRIFQLRSIKEKLAWERG